MNRSLFAVIALFSFAVFAFGAAWTQRRPEGFDAPSSMGTEIFSLASSVTRRAIAPLEHAWTSRMRDGSDESAKTVSPVISALNPKSDAGDVAPLKKVKMSAITLPAWMEGLFSGPAWTEGEENPIREEVERRVRAFVGALQGGSVPSAASKASAEVPGPFAYRVRAFYPGTGAQGRPIAQSGAITEDLVSRVMGPPDYSVWSQDEQPNRLLSLGANGILILEVESGWVTDGPGADFVVFENPFPVAGSSDVVFAETARVSVAEEDREDAYRTFPCDSVHSPYAGCAGVRPVIYHPDLPLDQVGGDAFDLADVGLRRIKFIRIQDTGDQASLFPGKEGFDLDALAFLHTEAP